MKSRLEARKKMIQILLPVLLLIVFSIAGVLFALFPSEDRLKTLAVKREADALSVAYLQLLLRTHPEDVTLRYTLSRHLAWVGKWEEAEKVIAPLLATQALALETSLVKIDIAWARLIATPKEDTHRIEIKKNLVSLIQPLLHQKLSVTELSHMATISRAMEEPQLAASFYMQLANSEPSKEYIWLTEAAHAFFESNLPLEAASIFKKIAQENDLHPDVKRKYVLLALDAYLKADKGQAALAFTKEMLDTFGHDRGLLERVVALALSQQDMITAKYVGQKLLTLFPDDPIVLEQQINVALASKDLSAAQNLAQHLVDVSPNHARRVRLAEIAQWNKAPKIALLQWSILAKDDPHGPEMIHALTLSFQLGEEKTWLELLAMVKPPRLLKPEEENMLGGMREKNNVSPLLVSYLKDYLAHYPRTIRLWEVLTDIQADQGDVSTALATWEHITPQYVSRVDSNVYQAAILVRAKKTSEAWAKLTSVRPLVKETDLNYWRLFGDMSWQDKQLGEALKAYQTIWNQGKVEATVAERLIELYNNNHQAIEAIHVGQIAYDHFHEPRWLILAMDAASRGGEWGRLKKMLETAHSDEASFRKSDLYWLLQAYSAEHDGKIDTARQAYREALLLNKQSTSTRLALIWFEINHGDKIHLANYLKEWQPDAIANTDYWAAYAAGFRHLKQLNTSLFWFQKKAAQSPHDYLWLLTYAETLTQAKKIIYAERLKHYVYTALKAQWDPKNEMTSLDDQTKALAYASLVQAFEGIKAAEKIWRLLLQKGIKKDRVYEALVAAYLVRKDDESAYYWMKQAQREHYTLPAWQRLSIALLKNDYDGIHNVLEEKNSTAPLSLADQVTALKKLGRQREAWALTQKVLDDPLHGDDTFWLEQKELLNKTLSRDIDIHWNKRTFAGLRIDSTQLMGSMPIKDSRLDMVYTHHHLGSNDRTLFLAQLPSEDDLSLTTHFFARDKKMRVSIGVNNRHDQSLLYGRYALTYPLHEKAHLYLDAWVNAITDETPAMRVVGAKDKISLGADILFSREAYARATLAAQRFHTRSGTTLGKGYRIDTEVGATLFKKTPFWQMRVSGSIERNHLADHLPTALLGTILPLSTQINSVVSPRFSTLGIGSSIGLGHKEQATLSTQPYGIFDVWAGKQWPGHTSVYILRAMAGIPLFKTGQLSIEGFYGTAGQSLGAGSTNKGVTLLYQYRF